MTIYLGCRLELGRRISLSLSVSRTPRSYGSHVHRGPLRKNLTADILMSLVLTARFVISMENSLSMRQAGDTSRKWYMSWVFFFLEIKSRLCDPIRSASSFQLRIIDSRPQISATFTQVTKPQPTSRVGEIARSSCPCSARRSSVPVGTSAASGIVSGPFSRSLVCPGLLTLLILLSSVCSLVP